MNLRIGPAALALALCAGVTGAPVGQEEQPFSQDPSGILELAGQSRLVVERIPGKIYLRVGKTGELRYMAHALEQRREERPVALFLRGRTMVLRPVEGREDEPLLLEIAISPGVAAELDLVESQLSVSGIQSSVKVRARHSIVDVRNIDGDLELDLEGGRLSVDGVLGGLTLEASDVEATLARIEGPLSVTADDGRLELTETLAEIEIDADGTAIGANAVGRLDAQVRNAELRLNDARLGGDLRLEETPLHVANSRGDLRVETDALVSFENLQGALTVNGFGSGLRGTKIVGAVEVITDNAAVELEGVEGPARVQGNGLDLKLTQIKGDVEVDTISSAVIIDRAEGPVEIKAEFGDVGVYNATQSVKIDSRDGNVLVVNLAGSVQLKAEGERVEVSWASLEGDTNQSVENARGDVWLSFPTNAQGTLQASATEGTILSSVSGVAVSDDGRTASGNLGGGMRPMVRVRAGGDLHLRTRQAPPAPRKESKPKIEKFNQRDQ